MPLLVKDFSWTQTEGLVLVKVPLHNKRPHKVDLFTSSKYVKAHFPPYMFEVALREEIDDETSKCVLRDNHILFELVKREPIMWTSLTKELTRLELIRLKEEAIDETHQKSETLVKDKALKKSERQSACVKQHMTLEENARASIKNKKEQLKMSAVADVMRWKNDETDSNTALLPLWKKLQAKCFNLHSAAEDKVEKDDRVIFDGPDGDAVIDLTNEKKKDKGLRSLKPGKLLPPSAPVRRFVNIKCDFTHRSFPTPMRESKYTEEEEWLSKQAEARRKTGFIAEDLRPEENNAEWLLEKGKAFHEVGNYLGAVSAFSHAIRTWDKIAELYAARASSQIELGNWRRAMSDASECLELCRPHVADNANLRFACHLARGRALLEVGKGSAASADFVEALQLRPDDGRLEHLIDRAELMTAEQENAETQETMRRLITTDPEAKSVDTTYLSPADLAN